MMLLTYKRALSGLLVHDAAGGSGTADRLHRTLDRSPQPADFGSRAAFRKIFAGAFALAERHQKVGAVGDLPAPHRRTELVQRLACNGDDAAFDLVAPGRCTVEHDRIRFARRTAHLN